MTKWGSVVEHERRRRIFLCVWAYAYEFGAAPLVEDYVFDFEASMVDPQVNTGNDVLDKFFREEFDPDTGMWIHKHPDLEGIKRVYERVMA